MQPASRVGDVHAPAHQQPHWGCSTRILLAKAQVRTSWQGLVKVELASKTVTLLTSRVDGADARAPGTTIDYANDPDIAPGGKVYFSDSAHGVFPVRNRFGYFDTMQAYMLTMFQARRARGAAARAPCVYYILTMFQE